LRAINGIIIANLVSGGQAAIKRDKDWRKLWALPSILANGGLLPRNDAKYSVLISIERRKNDPTNQLGLTITPYNLEQIPRPRV
jgi:hypothetical protein